LLQVCSVVQAEFDPQWQCPPEEQLFALVELQATHVTPPTPQLEKLDVLQRLFEQHPDGQDVPSQAQTPLTQRCPVTHGALLPQWQVPPEQVSASVELHAMQVPPLAPQADSDGVVQTLPVQQPLGQDVALHPQEPPEQVCPAPQAGPEPH
jgi:hypothetical protein